MDVYQYNRNAWNLQSLEGCRWSTPFSGEVIERARAGDWSVILTPNRAVPPEWFPSHPRLDGVRILALASGGGQQVPVFAAAGADVVSFDASDVQLEKDLDTCARHGLDVEVYQGDMADLSAFDDVSFDLVFNPVSNVFAENLDPIWAGCARVLRPGGHLLCGFMNPAFFLFDHRIAEETGEMVVKYRLPFADTEHLSEEELGEFLEAQLSVEFSHSWESQVGGQCRAGFLIADLYEDTWDDESTAVNRWMPTSAATWAIRKDDSSPPR